MSDAYQQSVIEQAEEYAEKVIRPQAGQFDRQESLPREIIDGLASRGLLGAPIPAQYGGLGLDPLYYGKLTEIIGKACCSTRSLLTVHTSLVGETLVKLGTPAQRERFLPDLAKGNRIACFALSEPGVGTDATSVKTRYEKRGDTYVLNGGKKWISFAGIADLYLVIAADGDTVSAFLVERTAPGLSVKPMSGLLGNRASHLAEVFFDNVEVPAENVLGRLGTGFSFVANTALFYGRYSIAWAGVAIGQAALEEMVGYACEREQFGQKIGEFQLVKGMIADAVTQIHAARALCERSGRLRMSGDDDAVMEVNMAKYFCSKMALQVTADAVQVFGGNGCWNEYPVERLFRESKILEVIEGTSQVQQVMIANHGMRRYRRHKVV
ncbi:acyl-CoA dehydrogenase family protein [Paenibacillus tyrfis]|uniref:acyl-CoA dehydrogenase family protein n=1 Tax=Paenibacillus tyrfis TaxID=1501230 RepID=UPI00209D5963|nr:acyl-CoA dehydrogenase family protein [Paenibacillus tyrfis]MCP1311727.1 acyl-CoA dehydrogenase family protein [Paenibacillus tyrfis]